MQGDPLKFTDLHIFDIETYRFLANSMIHITWAQEFTSHSTKWLLEMSLILKNLTDPAKIEPSTTSIEKQVTNSDSRAEYLLG